MFCKIVIALFGLYLCALAHEVKSVNRNPSLYEAIEKLLDHAKYDIQGTKIAVLLNELNEARSAETGERSFSHHVSSSYTRWGRRTCPKNSVLVYEGFGAGGMFTSTGAPANYMCLPKQPDWDNHKKTPRFISLIYGSEYATIDSVFNKLHDHEVPCAVCRVPRSSTLMIPGKNTCFENYVKEYQGYLMAGHQSNIASSEYVCVDGEAEATSMSSADDLNGKLIYFIRAKCGSLKCPPYKKDDDLTCVVCSYSPKL